MKRKTLGEQYFERYYRLHNVPFRRIPESLEQRTPDYELELCGTQIAVEVKDVNLSPDEEAAQEALRKGETVVLSETPGRRVRSKVSDAASQLKAYAAERMPSILLLFGTGQSARWLDPYDVLVGMYGLQTIDIAIPADLRTEPFVARVRFGESRSVNEARNTTISAIATLTTPGPESLALCIYHNVHAAVPLPVRCFESVEVPQYSIDLSECRSFSAWQRITTDHPIRAARPVT